MLKKLMGILLAVLMALLLSLPALTEGADGLNIHLSADQAEYGKKDDITVTLTVRNTDRTGVNYADIRLLNEVPNGYILQAGSSAEKTIRLLKAGEEATLTSVFHPVYIPSTGDQGIGTPLLIGGIALFCLLFLLSVKKGRYMHLFRSMMCFLLVISMTAAALPVTALAASLTIPFSTVVKVEGKEIKLNSLVTYEPLKHEPENSLTIADILPDDFPRATGDYHESSPQGAWRSVTPDSANRCFIAHLGGPGQMVDGDCIIFRRASNIINVCSLDNVVQEEGGNYCYYYGSDSTPTVILVMTEGKLTSIVFDEHWKYSTTSGTYVPPDSAQENELTIADILPEDFPHSENESWAPPQTSWSSPDGFMCYTGSIIVSPANDQKHKKTNG